MILTLKKEMQLHWIMMIMSLILSRVFDLFAPIYGLFYNYQKVHYKAVIDGVQDELNFSAYENIIDGGCGTGALCSVLKIDVDQVYRL